MRVEEQGRVTTRRWTGPKAAKRSNTGAKGEEVKVKVSDVWDSGEHAKRIFATRELMRT